MLVEKIELSGVAQADFFIANRLKLIEKLGGGLMVLTAYTAQQRRGDASFPFEQEANFWYLTGIEHADWRLIIDGAAQKTWLIAPDVDAVHQVFSGSLSMDKARQLSGVDVVLSQQEGKQLLQDMARKHRHVYTLGTPPYATYVDFALNPAQHRLTRQLKRLFGSVKDCYKDLAALRAIKQPVEIAAMEASAILSVEAFQNLRTKLSSYTYEYEVEAELTYSFRRRNAGHAFEPIVASGKNACTLHYVQNSESIQSGLLLIDAGARQHSYPADITRTFAIGETTKRHIAVHKAVQEAEESIIQLVKPGLELIEYIKAVDDIMKQALLKLDLIKNSGDMAAYRRYFPHTVSHGLGIDVHESLGGYKKFEAGMVITVEPGIYIPEEGIGVRIEDDILVMNDGSRNLTAGLSTEL